MRRAVAVTMLVGLALLSCKKLGPGSTKRSGSDPSCGTSPSDWCDPVPGDPCGDRRSQAECRADSRCEAWPYAGESAAACITDERCFASNCPSVGCVMRCEGLDAESCERPEPCRWKGQSGTCSPGEKRCAWDGHKCTRTKSCELGLPTPRDR